MNVGVRLRAAAPFTIAIVHTAQLLQMYHCSTVKHWQAARQVRTRSYLQHQKHNYAPYSIFMNMTNTSQCQCAECDK